MLFFVFIQNERIIEKLNDVAISINSEFYWLNYSPDQKYFKILQVYRVSATASLAMEYIGRIEDSEFIDYRWTPITSRRRKNLYDLSLRASMVVTNNDTLSHLTDYR